MQMLKQKLRTHATERDRERAWLNPMMYVGIKMPWVLQQFYFLTIYFN